MLKFLCDKLKTFSVCFQNSVIPYWNELYYWVCFFSLLTFYFLPKWKYLIGYVSSVYKHFNIVQSVLLSILFLISLEMFVYKFTMSNLFFVFLHALHHRIQEKCICQILNSSRPKVYDSDERHRLSINWPSLSLRPLLYFRKNPKRGNKLETFSIKDGS